MIDDTLHPFDLPAVSRKKVTAAFDGGLISSDGGLMILREADRRLGLAVFFAGFLRDRRDQALFRALETIEVSFNSDGRHPLQIESAARGILLRNSP